MDARTAGSRLHLTDLPQAVLKQFLLIGLGDPLFEDRFGSFAGQLAGVLRQFVTRMLQAVVHFVARRLQDFLRFGFGSGDELALLTIALLLRALVNRFHFVLDLRQAILNVVRQMIGFRATIARFDRGGADRFGSRSERTADRTLQRPDQYAEEEEHVGELPDPHRKAEKLQLAARAFAFMRALMRDLLGSVSHVVRLLRFLTGRGDRDQKNKDEEKRAFHTGLPRMRSAAIRASDSDSVLMRSRAPSTSFSS